MFLGRFERPRQLPSPVTSDPHSPTRRLHVAIITHTPRHLRRVLHGVACLRDRDGLIVISCDNVSPEVAEVVRQASAELALRLSEGFILVQRPTHGFAAPSQARNNAFRALLSLGASRSDLVGLLDGDCVPAADWAREIARELAQADVAVGYRYDLTEAQTEDFDESALDAGSPPIVPTLAQTDELSHRQSRYERSLLMRRVGLAFLTKPHKPKVLSANVAMRVDALLDVNGFDEEYTGYGCEDDDFGRRLYASGAQAAVVVNRAIVYHQWHPTRKPADWNDAPGVARFNMDLPTRAIHGIVNPMPQPSPLMTRVVAGEIASTGLIVA